MTREVSQKRKTNGAVTEVHIGDGKYGHAAHSFLTCTYIKRSQLHPVTKKAAAGGNRIATCLIDER